MMLFFAMTDSLSIFKDDGHWDLFLEDVSTRNINVSRSKVAVC